jgi:hypothetical protein
MTFQADFTEEDDADMEELEDSEEEDADEHILCVSILSWRLMTVRLTASPQCTSSTRYPLRQGVLAMPAVTPRLTFLRRSLLSQ